MYFFFSVIIALSPELSEFANFEISVRFIALYYNSAYIRSFPIHNYTVRDVRSLLFM